MHNLIDSTKKNFFNYLTSLGISQKSHKNYRSDISHFHAWLTTRVKSIGSFCETLGEAIPFLNSSVAFEYVSQLVNTGVPAKTINRRLSTLRHLSRFLTSTQLLNFDFMAGIENITSVSVVNEFRAHLEGQKASPNTIKNYLSDIRQFLTWLEANQEILNSTAKRVT